MCKKIAILLIFVCGMFGGGASVGASVNPNIDRAVSSCGTSFGKDLNVGVSYAKSATSTEVKFDTHHETFVTSNGYCYTCDSTPHKCYGCSKAWELEYGKVMQTLYGDAYKCSDTKGGYDKWESTAVRWCSDTQIRELKVNGVKYCLIGGGKEIACRIYGDTKNLVHNNAYDSGCLRATLTEKDVEKAETDAPAVQKATKGTATANGKKAGDACTAEDLKGVPHAKNGEYKARKDGSLYCYATVCEAGAFKVNKNGQYMGYCATDAICPKNEKLKLNDDKKSVEINSQGKFQCVKAAGECEQKPAHAEKTKLEWNATTRVATCTVVSCVDGYKVQDNKCVEKTDTEKKEEQKQKNATGDRVISGVVTCLDKACDGANVVCEKTVTKGVSVSRDGSFSLKCPINEGVNISFFGMTTINISAKELAEKSVGLSIELKEEPIQMADVVVVACHDEAKGIKTGTLKDDVCVPTGCITQRWNLQGEDENAKCVEQECEHGWKQDESGKWVCEQNVQQTSGTAVETAQGADQAAVTDAAKGEEETKSEDKTEAETQAQAEDKSDGTECKSGAANVARGVWRDGKCVPAACNDGYELKDDNCVEIGGPCEGKPENSVSSHREFDPSTKKIECVIDSCKAGYVVSKDRFECEEDLEEKVKAAKEKEQSLGNRMLGGAAMGAAGAGGQMLATGLAEKKADENAEREMRAYLDTMNCEYGSGKIIKGGTKAVVIPGGNELINLYSQYVNLANDLKVRKEALGMRPGIEAEAILDGATSGLYDDVSVGKTSGAYTSLARALQNPDGADAAAWAAQKEESQKQIKTGAIVAGAGAVVGLVGNVISNSDAVQNRKAKTAAVRKKYAPVIEDVENLQVQADTMSGKACSEFTGTTNSGSVPNCECTKSDEEFSVDNGGCIDKDKAESASAACSKVGVVMPGTCECVDNATLEGSVCTCKDGWHETEDKACVKNDDGKEQTDITSLTLSSDVAFQSGGAKLTSQAKEVLNDFCKTLQEHHAGLFAGDNYKIVITGHTDRVPFKNNSNGNQQLSEARANAVKDELSKCSLATIDKSRMQVAGVADAECTSDKYPKPNDPACRKVKLSLWVAHEELSDVISNFGAGVTDALGGGVSGINLGDLDLSVLAK